MVEERGKQRCWAEWDSQGFQIVSCAGNVTKTLNRCGLLQPLSSWKLVEKLKEFSSNSKEHDGCKSQLEAHAMLCSND